MIFSVAKKSVMGVHNFFFRSWRERLWPWIGGFGNA